jgi:hypothetical protein
MDIRERLVEQYGDDELLFADGFDESIIGVSIGTPHRVVYDARFMVATLIMNDSMGYSDAWEYLEFNTFQAYVGERTPIYVNLEKRIRP